MPILAVVFAIVKGFGILEGLIANLYGVFPQQPEIIDYVVEFADRALANTQSSVVAAVGIVMLFWAVIRVFGSIESAFNNIWEVSSTRSLARKYSDYISVIVVAPILWAAASGVGAYTQELMGVGGSAWLGIVSRFSSMAVIWVMFTFLYYIIPNTSVRFGSALTSGIVAGTAFILFQWGYVYLQRMMTSYNAIYGSFAALPLFLLWVQYSWTILLFGGELSFAYQNIDKFDEERESLRIDYDSRRKVLLAATLVVLRHFIDGDGAVALSEVRRRLNLPTRIVNSVLYSLVDAGLLIELPAEGKGYEARFVPARDADDFTVYGVLEAVDLTGDRLADIDASEEVRRMGEELEKIKTEVRRSQNNLRLVEIKFEDE